jgi:PAS domain-containing protein
MLSQHEQAPSSAVMSQPQTLTAEPSVYLNSDGTIQSLNSSACRLLNVDSTIQAEGRSITEFIHFSLTSLTKVCKSFFEGTFSNSSNTIIPSVNARFSYTFSYDSMNEAVKLVLKDNPFS